MLAYLTHPEWLKPEIIPGLPFRWYGLMYILAFLTAYLLFMYQIKKRKLEIEKDTIINAFFWGIVGLLVGARIFYMLFFDTSGTFWRAPWSLLLPFNERWEFTGYSGMNYYGGVVGGVIGMVIYLRRKKQDLLEWGDMLIAGVPLGHTFGRLGNFINGELYGRLTTAPWGMVFHSEGAGIRADDHPAIKGSASEVGITLPQGSQMVDLPRHPTQVYEMLFESLMIWAILWFIFRTRKPFKGFIIGLYIAIYGVVRFVIDYFRMPLRDHFLLKLGPQNNPVYLLLSPFNFTLDQLFSLLMVIGGVVFLWYRHRKSQRGRLSPADQPAPDLRKMRKKIDKE
ncbi:MAG TPA: prolipoprotein diacylglyceryl transferase [Spirochaetia bacterium]|nr:prolipoprotein diacylglyceryl transferase [Spirochaetia bacterium]